MSCSIFWAVARCLSSTSVEVFRRVGSACLGASATNAGRPVAHYILSESTLMSVYDELPKIAREIADRLSEQSSRIEAELAELRSALAAKETTLHLTRAASQRADTYEAIVGGRVTCPNCYVSDERVSLAVAQESDSELDRYRCHECGWDYQIVG
jgi:transposase-like protein